MKAVRIMNQHPGKDILSFSTCKAEEARTFHRTLQEYTSTPLQPLKGLAAALGLHMIYVKDESKRFGLNSFKCLGGSFAMHELIKDDPSISSFVTATDGNHGRGVAYAARKLGKKAFVFMPKGTAIERLNNIRKLGAHAEILDMQYDDCVRYAKRFSEENGGILVQDTAWPGYETIPARIMQGYTVMGLEIAEQLGDTIPTHIFLQAGVGAMAGAMCGFFADFYKERKPVITIVEPDGAACIYQTAKANDGNLHFIHNLNTIMAGLSCGEPCSLGWDQIEAYADFALCCPDRVSENGMRILSSPIGNDVPIISGESGAVTVGVLAELKRRSAENSIRQMIGLTEDSIVLCISTEGDTDRENYLKIIQNGSPEIY